MLSVKVFNKSELLDIELFDYDVTIIGNLDHPNILKIMEIYKDIKSFYFVCEEIQGDRVSNQISVIS